MLSQVKPVFLFSKHHTYSTFISEKEKEMHLLSLHRQLVIRKVKGKYIFKTGGKENPKYKSPLHMNIIS